MQVFKAVLHDKCMRINLNATHVESLSVLSGSSILGGYASTNHLYYFWLLGRTAIPS